MPPRRGAEPARRASPTFAAGWSAAAAFWIALIAWRTVVHFPWRSGSVLHAFDLSRFAPISFVSVLLQGGRVLAAVFLVAAWLAAAYGFGRPVRERWLNITNDKLTSLLYDLGIGFGLWSLVMFVLGVLPGWRPAVFVPLFAVAAVAGAVQVWRHRATLRPARGWLLGTRPAPVDRVWFALAMLAAAYVGSATVVPETFFDALVYHLGVPGQWLLHHRFTPLPHNYFSPLPMGISMLSTGSLILWDETLCRMLHWTLSVLAALGVFALGRRFFGRRAGLWGLGLFATTPLVLINAQAAGVDAGAAWFAVLAMHALAVWAFAGPRPEPGRLFAAAVFAGAAVAAKYNTVFFLAPAAVAAVFVAVRRRPGGISWPRLAAAGALALALLLPWWIKNAVETGNPVYPFLYRVFPSESLDEVKMAQQMGEFREYHHRTPVQFIRQPWDLSFMFATSNSYVGTTWLLVLPVFLIALPVWRRGPPWAWPFAFVVLAAALLWTSQTRIVRYFIPALTLLAVLFAAALDRFAAGMPRTVGMLRWGAAGLAAWGCLHLAMIGGSNWDHVGAALGVESRPAYKDRVMMNSYAPVARASGRLPEDSRILNFGETRVFGMARPTTAPTVFDRHPLLTWLEEDKSAEGVWRRLRGAGYTHVYLHVPEAVRTRGYEPHAWSDAAVRAFQDLRGAYLAPVRTARGQWLYAVRDRPRADGVRKTGRPLFTFDRGVTAKASGLFGRAVRLLRAGRLEDARALARRCAELAPGWYRPWLLLGEIALRKGQARPGWTFLERALSLDWIDPLPAFQIGRMAMEQGDTGRARRFLRAALAADPNLEPARRALRELGADAGAL